MKAVGCYLGMKIIESPLCAEQPMRLAIEPIRKGMTSESFRKEYNEWLRDFFGFEPPRAETFFITNQNTSEETIFVPPGYTRRLAERVAEQLVIDEMNSVLRGEKSFKESEEVLTAEKLTNLVAQMNRDYVRWKSPTWDPLKFRTDTLYKF